MVRIITREWEIAKTYIYEVALQEGKISLDWNDFESMAEEHRPMIAAISEGDGTVADLAKDAIREMMKHTAVKPKGIIVGISSRKDAELKMDEITELPTCLGDVGCDDCDISWGLNSEDCQESRISVAVFAFE